MALFPFSPPISCEFGYICLHNSAELCNLLSTAFPYVMTTDFPRFIPMRPAKSGENTINKLLTAVAFCGKVSVTALTKTCRFADRSERGSFGARVLRNLRCWIPLLSRLSEMAGRVRPL